MKGTHDHDSDPRKYKTEEMVKQFIMRTQYSTSAAASKRDLKFSVITQFNMQCSKKPPVASSFSEMTKSDVFSKTKSN